MDKKRTKYAMAESYLDFASVYDELMDETPYEKWCETVVSFIEKYGISKPERDAADVLSSERNLVLDLGCGTGTMTELLYRKGYDMIGVDNSIAMLQVAADKKLRSGSEILYLCQDMRQLDLYSTVGTVVSVCDSINYLLEDGDVADTFAGVANYLYPGGIFIFDFNTVYKYRQVIGDVTIAENREHCSFIWENDYQEQERINEYDLTLFLEEGDGRYRKVEETHYQRGYTPEEMRFFTEQAGMEVLLVMDADTGREPGETSERIYLVARVLKDQ